MNGKDETTADDKDREHEPGVDEGGFESDAPVDPPSVEAVANDPEERMLELSENLVKGMKDIVKDSHIEASWAKPAQLKELKIVLSTTPETLLVDIAKVKKALEWDGE